MDANFDELVAKLPPHERGDARELANNILFMREKLEETRKDLQFQDVTLPYDNGGGQTGTRENPAFKAYNALMKTYMSALTALRQMLGLDQPKATPKEEPKSNLAQARTKFSHKYQLVSGGP